MRAHARRLDLACIFPMHLAELATTPRHVVLLCSLPRLRRLTQIAHTFRTLEQDIKIIDVRRIALVKYLLMLLVTPHWCASAAFTIRCRRG